MAEPVPEPVPPSRIKGWLKALLGTLGGLLSGAIMMYVTPLFNQIVKPPRPLANFSVQAEGLEVRFHNLSPFGEGLWDFGDGSPLTKTAPDEFITHTYARPGDYTAKLMVSNRLGDENERAAPVHVEAVSAASTTPNIVSLEAIPVSAGSYAPATFKLVSKVKNAQVAVLDFGDDRPFQVATENIDNLEQMVTFQKPGGYVVKLAAFNGKMNEQKTEIITVMDAPSNSLTALLTITDAAEHVETQTHATSFSASYPPDLQAPSYAFQAEVKAWRGRTLSDLTFKKTDGQELHVGAQTELVLDAAALGLANVRNLRVQIADNRESALLIGELFVDRRTAAAPSLLLPVVLSVQKKTPHSQTIPVTTTLTVPVSGAFTSGTLLLPPMPKDCPDCQRQFHLEVLNNGVKIYETSQLQRSALVALLNRQLILTTSQTNEQVRIDLMDAPAGVTLAPR